MRTQKLFKSILATVFAVSVVATSVTPAKAAFKGDYFGLGFDAFDSSKCEKADGWSNGDMFDDCTWRAGNVNFSNGNMQLSITKDPYGETPYAGGEYRTKEKFGYGRYDVRMKPIKSSGVVSSFFTYTGPTDGTIWDEIDIEFLGKDTTKVQFNYYTNGIGNHEYLYDLGFDASKSFHNYGFIWEKGAITWCVDGKAVYTATSNIPTTPGKIMLNAWPGKNVDTWLGHFYGNVPLTAEYDWASYTSPEKLKQQNNNQNSGNSGNQQTYGIQSGATYFINSKMNSKSLDIAYWSKDKAANIQAWDYLNQDNQKWILQKLDNGYYIIKSAYSGKVLDVAYASKDNGANIQTWDNEYNANQMWKIEPVDDAYKIINVNSGKALEIGGSENYNGANIQQWNYNGNRNQLWYFTKL